MTTRPLPTLPRVLLLLAAFVLGGGGPSQAAAPDEAGFRDIANRLVTGFAAPASQTFLTTAKRLNKEAATACAAGGPPPETLRQAFRDTAEAWGRLSLARFGPLVDDSRYDKIAFWPDPRGVIRRQTTRLASQMPTDGDLAAWIGEQSAAVQGLPAFDLLTFGDDDAANRARTCRLAAAVAGNIERLATAVAEGFANPSRLAILTPKEDNPLYRTWRDSVANLFNVYATQIDVLRGTMIGEALSQTMAGGAASGASTPPTGGDARPVRLFLRHAPATKAFLVGAAGGLGDFLAAMHLDPFVADDPRGLIERTRQDLQAVREPIDALPPDLAAALAEPATGQSLSMAARALERFHRDVIVGYVSALGLQMGFNALDGD